MGRLNITRRHAFTVIELIVAIAVLAVLFALLFPAIQSARETSRKSVCQNNLKQIALAVHDHDSTYGVIPALYNGTPDAAPRSARDEFHFHSWRSKLLPHLEQAPLFEQLVWDDYSTVVANQPALNITVDTFVCPSRSTPTQNLPEVFEHNPDAFPDRVIGTAAVSDYESIVAFQSTASLSSTTSVAEGLKAGAWGVPNFPGNTLSGGQYPDASFDQITDGLSQALLVVERAGRPDWYNEGVLADAYPYELNSGTDSHQAAWGISTHFLWLIVNEEQPINQTNGTGLFSFHQDGAFAALADGSVRFLNETMSVETLAALTTRAEGDIVDRW